MRVVGITGNFTRPSKTRALAEYAIARASEGRGTFVSFDLLDVFPGLGNTIWRGETTAEVTTLLDEIERCDLLVVGSPVYKASYTGMLKHLFDLLDMKSLNSRPVLAFATGKAPGHGKQVEAHMRSLFEFFDARMAGKFVYALDEDFVDGVPGSSIKSIVDREVDEALKLVDA